MNQVSGCYLAIDLGAESGRVIAGEVSNSAVQLTELHRFQNRVSKNDDGSMFWHHDELLENSIIGLEKAIKEGFEPKSISVDSWGVDYILFDDQSEWILPGHHYRDSRTEQGVRNTFDKISLENLYSETGIQHMPLNTLYQVMAEPEAKLNKAKTILGVGDAINHKLGGRPVYEVSMASTTQIYNPHKKKWSDRVIEKTGLRKSMFPEIVESGKTIGRLKKEIQDRIGHKGSPPFIIATCSHDTGAAVAAIPAEGNNWAYLSSGTWSLMGLELREPILTPMCREFNFTNEVGYGHSIRLLKNISGMWLIQECRREWLKQGEDLSYKEMSDLASEAEGFRSLINPSSHEFIAPDSMTNAMRKFCNETGQPEPNSKGQFLRCALDSLALLYRKTLIELEQLTGKKSDVLHIVGGGSQHELLNQLAADICKVKVAAGPVEATALGNVLIQHATLTGSSLREIRKLVHDSFQVKNYTPNLRSDEETVWKKFLSICDLG